MPVAPSYPGVYVQEVPSGVRTLTGVGTSITAFIGAAPRGAANTATRINSFADFERQFGGLAAGYPLGYALLQYFRNGGSQAVVVRAVDDATPSAASGIGGALSVAAKNPGAWGNRLRVSVLNDSSDPSANFNLRVVELDASNVEVAVELHRNLSPSATDARSAVSVIAQASTLINVTEITGLPTPASAEPLAGGSDGSGPVPEASIIGDSAARTGIYALDGADLFNLLVLAADGLSADAIAAATAYCKARRALHIASAPASWTSTAEAEAGMSSGAWSNLRDANLALYYPQITARDPLAQGRLRRFPPAAAVAGVIARTDSQRGVWKAPAGIEANLLGVSGLSATLTDSDSGALNPLGLNCLRSFPTAGTVVWGARTMRGADALSDEWKYLPVRRLALYIEESLYRGTQWAVFEPNDAELWGQLRSAVTAFMQNLFLQGAFQGSSPEAAYFVRCDADTNSQYDIDRGVVNVQIGFAPLKPAEFVFLHLQQKAGGAAN